MPKSESTSAGAGSSFLRMGGMALQNGLILVSEKHWAAAVRDKDGSIKVASGTKDSRPSRVRPGSNTKRGRRGTPLLRSLDSFAGTLLVMAQVKHKLPSAELPMESSRVIAALAASLGGTAVVRAWAAKSPLVEEIGEALVSFVPAVLAVKNSPMAGYHGAEHKVIGAQEALVRSRLAADANSTQKGPVSFDARSAPKEHNRCGTNLVGPYLVASVATNVLARKRFRRGSPAVAVASVAGLGLALEAVRWAASHSDHPLAKAMLYPGRVVQERFTTAEPSAEQLEVGQRALAELLRLEGGAEGSPATSQFSAAYPSPAVNAD